MARPIYIDVQEDFAPVLAVNGKVGYVNLTAGDIEGAVSTTGDQTISGQKSFVLRPDVDGTGVLLSGEAIVSSNDSVTTIITITTAEYNSIPTPDPKTLYLIT